MSKQVEVPEWPSGLSDGLSLPCHDCWQVPRFDYQVTDEFWQRWVPDKPERLGVICLPCLDKRCGGLGLAKALRFIQWTGTGHTVELVPERRYAYGFPGAKVEITQALPAVPGVPETAKAAAYGVIPGNAATVHERVLEAAYPHLLLAIYKHFSDRLLSDEAVEAACRSSVPDWREDSTEHTPAGEAIWDEVKDALRAALQAASIPKGTER